MAADRLTVLSLDPSSTCCGYALGVVDAARREVASHIWIGRVRPVASWPVERRLRAIAEEIDALVGEAVREHGLSAGVVEVMTRTHHRRGGEGKAHQRGTTMRLEPVRAQGVCEGVLALRGVPHETVDPAQWTGPYNARGVDERGQKDARRRTAATRCRAYDPAKDPGGDIADAILILEWWANRAGTQETGKRRRA